MATTATLSSKGQITLPASVRDQLELHQGDRFAVTVDEGDGHIELRRLRTLDELAQWLTSQIPPGTPPVTDPRAYYAEHHEPRV